MPSSASVSEGSGVSARTLVAQYFRIWNDGDPAHLADILSPDWVDHAHPERQSVEDVSRAIADARTARPDLRVLVDATLGNDSLVTVNGRVCTSEGTKSWVWIVRVEDDRLREMWTHRAD